MNLNELTVTELLEKRLNGPELTGACLARCREVEPKIHAFRMLDEKQVEANRRAAAEVSNGKLSGIPVAIKDNICIEGEETCCASRILAGFRPPYDATVIEKLKQAGAVLFGRANMDEFAFGSSTENSAFGPTRNPWDPERIPGGSSGGSAAAVAAREVPLALGSDTGGSIRQPAALCGVVGMKPTYGRVSRYGLIAFASSLDQIGPFARSVHDTALLLEVIAGFDPRDSTSADVPVPAYTREIEKEIRGMTIGVPKEYFVAGIEPEVEASMRAAVKVLEKLGARAIEVNLPHTEYAVAVYYLVATAEASSNLARFDGVQYGYRSRRGGKAADGALVDTFTRTRGEGFGEEAKRRIILGTYVLSAGYYDAYYLRAQKVRTLIKGDFDRAFGRCDAIVTPTSPTAAFKTGEKTGDPLAMYLSDIFTIPANLAGIPGVSVPCGFTGSGLPVGLQILGKPFAEATILRIAHHYEQATDWRLRKPKF